MIEPEVVTQLESPCSLLVGTVSAAGVPESTRGWGIELLGPDRLRVLLASNADRTLANLERGGPVALTTTNFVTLVSWQLKGHAVAVESATSADRILFDEFCAGCIRILHETEGTPEPIIARMVPPGIVSCEMVVEQVFDQTPGPDAGARVAPVGT